ncbi:trypsin-like [Ochlerotatus camptorhynchus]|uniref:trypsin-like n=1 Tax=Ochlerotatus camptorhynchus TaxID=644619 RepID=UPI0031D681F8
MSLYPFLLVLVASASAFVLPDTNPDPLFIGGTVASFGAFPAVAYIVAPDRELCGAAVIDARHVVTLAQCVLNATYNTINPRLVRVHTGELNLVPVSHTRQTQLGDVIYVHPNFKAHTLENDVAVIRVQEPFHIPSNEVEPANRRTHIVANGATCYLAGWGAIDPAPGSIINPMQRFIPMVINDRDVCNTIRRERQIFESMICAGNTDIVQNGPAPCHGSLGSGLYCHGNLTGLLSYGLNCGMANNPPTFTQIRFFNPWIQQQLIRTDRPPAGMSPLDVV